MAKRPKKDIVEIFGHSPDDQTNEARELWTLEACPFLFTQCLKTNHDKSVVYGTCSVTSPYGDCIICPNRLYADAYSAIKDVANDAFGAEYPFLFFKEYMADRKNIDSCVVALGQNSGKEVKLGRSLSMDWVLAKVVNKKLVEYTGIEVQSIDITGNYRDCWYAYKDIEKAKVIPESGHGMNWANVHKRLIPQLIRKGLVYSKSAYVKSGIYFVLPDIVYKKFEEIIGSDIPTVTTKAANHVTVFTYALGAIPEHGTMRPVIPVRKLRFTLEEFSSRFIAGATLPASSELDKAIMKILGI